MGAGRGATAGGRADAQRLSGVVDLATDTGAAVARLTAVSELRDFYTAGYSLADRAEAERMGRWRALGARSKADHAVRRCARRAGLRPRTLVEIGCGDGALLAELGARGLAPVLDGFELSPPAAEIARGADDPGRAADRGLRRRARAGGGRRLRPRGRSRTCSSTSRSPAPLLREAARVAPAVLVEVPLEANRSAGAAAKRAEAARIGHIQFLDRAAVHALVAGRRAGASSPSSATPSPTPTTRSSPRPRPARAAAALKAGVRRALWRVAPRAAERLFTVHYACLARRR